VIAVSVVSPFLKFKNASKETIDASDELVAEIRFALMAAGGKLSKLLAKEAKADEREERRRYMESFSPIFVESLCRLTQATPEQKSRAEAGMRSILSNEMANFAPVEEEKTKPEEKIEDEGVDHDKE
ncbi:MAG: DNA topoisomerase VI subunit B, partial [Proteobacteria bacterium]